MLFLGYNLIDTRTAVVSEAVLITPVAHHAWTQVQEQQVFFPADINVFSRYHFVEHIVQPGDTFSSISRLFGVDWQEILEFNALQNINTLRVGDTIVIPIRVFEEVSATHSSWFTETSPEPILTASREIWWGMDPSFPFVDDTTFLRDLMFENVRLMHEIELLRAQIRRYEFLFDEIMWSRRSHWHYVDVWHQPFIHGVHDRVLTGAFHTVEAWETLDRIADIHGAEVRVIAVANDLTDLAVTPRQTLFIPWAAHSYIFIEIDLMFIPLDMLLADIHTVSIGETLYSIAQMYNISREDIMAASHIWDVNVFPGQRLYIPRGIKIGYPPVVLSFETLDVLFQLRNNVFITPPMLVPTPMPVPPAWR